MMEELVKMSEKGQLVVPKEIRERQRFSSSDRFVAFEVKSGVLFKRVNIPHVKAEFESLSREIAKQFKERKVKRKDAEEAIKWARKRR
ncbi:MAG: AbrB/MazE/SpoVT family DNA-binding domain-containing protein [Candidatus Aenigmarchaeota archaeon]|nr:AbrB/MazE/SpoVT family DNA-binding domain-containing protein [Candidatus Aenigmarchaeota archaeon]